MAFQVSPGVNVSEIDLTTVIPAVSTSTGAVAAHLRWGPVNQRVLVDNEDTLVKNFGQPNTNTASDFFTAANFLSYGNALYVTRVVRANTSSTDTAAARSATTNAANTKNFVIKSQAEYEEVFYTAGQAGVGPFVARYPGELGNSLRISVCPTSNAYQSVLAGNFTFTNNSLTVTTDAVQTGKVVAGDILLCGPDKQPIKVAAVAGNANNITLQSKYVGNTVTLNTTTRRWEYYGVVTNAPGSSASAVKNRGSNDEIHVVVIDEDGQFSGISNTVLEVFPNLSKASGVTDEVGNNIYYKDFITKNSRYVHWAAHQTGWTNAGVSVTKGVNFGIGTQGVLNLSFSQGRDGSTPREADYITSYNLYSSAQSVDVAIVLGASAGATRATHIINNICEKRMDCIAVISPPSTAVVNNSGYAGKEADDIITYRDSLPSSSYAVMDSGWKYQYDKYNDLYRYVPLNGDIGGLMVRTDNQRDPWWSPAGYTRGQIKNTIRLAYNPGKADRDALYKKGINPVVTFPGEGTILFGDKTMLSKPSAFDRINVRRLFIVLEKAISAASKYTLFEFNDAFTRSQFKSLVEPFLRNVQGRRGITDFKVVCDESNNTSEVIDRNEFIGDIYIKPAKSINYIQLNFVAVRSGVSFSEVVGKF